METELLAAVTQFGVAGLIGWMWTAERRAASVRDRQIAEAQERLLRERKEMEILIGVVKENTRALAGLEESQRTLAQAVERLGMQVMGAGRRLRGEGRGAGREGEGGGRAA